MFTALAENFGDVQNKVNLFIALSPVAYLSHTENEFLKDLAQDIDGYKWWMNHFGITRLFGPEWGVLSEGLCMVKKELC